MLTSWRTYLRHRKTVPKGWAATVGTQAWISVSVNILLNARYSCGLDTLPHFYYVVCVVYVVIVIKGKYNFYVCMCVVYVVIVIKGNIIWDLLQTSGAGNPTGVGNPLGSHHEYIPFVIKGSIRQLATCHIY